MSPEKIKVLEAAGRRAASSTTRVQICSCAPVSPSVGLGHRGHFRSEHLGCYQELKSGGRSGPSVRGFGSEWLWPLRAYLPGLPAPGWCQSGTMSGPGLDLPPRPGRDGRGPPQTQRASSPPAAALRAGLAPEAAVAVALGATLPMPTGSTRFGRAGAGEGKEPRRQRWPRRPGAGPRAWLPPRPASSALLPRPSRPSPRTVARPCSRLGRLQAAGR